MTATIEMTHQTAAYVRAVGVVSAVGAIASAAPALAYPPNPDYRAEAHCVGAADKMPRWNPRWTTVMRGTRSRCNERLP